MRILIADTDEVLLEFLEPYLRKRGHEVQLATQGLECITCARQSTPDVVVLSNDLLWGGCLGILDELRKDPLLSNIPVILIADAREEFDALSDTRVVAWLQKPFHLSSLMQEIVSAFNHSRKARGETRDLVVDNLAGPTVAVA